MKSLFSDKEYEMISVLSPHWKSVIDNDITNTLNPPKILELIALECFINKIEGKAADSLRRCLSSLIKCQFYRFTPEYEDLIDL